MSFQVPEKVLGYSVVPTILACKGGEHSKVVFSKPTPAAPEAFFSLRYGSHPPFESPVNTGLKHTQKYTRAIDSLKLKREAIDSLPDISF